MRELSAGVMRLCKQGVNLEMILGQPPEQDAQEDIETGVTVEDTLG